VRRRFSGEDGTELAATVAGDGPCVLLIHGFPGTSYSWRHQVPALADAGYQAVAVDCRGYGDSGRPAASCYPGTTVLGDLLAVLDGLDVGTAHVVGQDFGAQYAWSLAQRHPERVTTVLTTVPFQEPGEHPPTVGFAAVAARHFLHLHYFQEAGRAEQDLGGDRLAEFLRRLLWALSAEGDLLAAFGHGSDSSYLDALPPAPPLPWRWLTETDFATFVDAYAAGGGIAHPGRELAGGLASYRAADVDWAEARRWADTPISVPAKLVMGERDPVRTFAEPDPGDVVFVPGAGHHVQQEQPAVFTRILLDWLSSRR
jgi:pimeloyl-ACP methyl ester carboxylesterase